MPVVDAVAQDYLGQVDVVTVAWRSSYEAAAAAAPALLPSGNIRWSFDGDESVFSAFEMPYQPGTVLIVQGVEVDRWLGAKGEDGLRESFEMLKQYG